ncbi:hypothetical protein AVEN_182977-1 [Araneus ventricosus]|uniref:Uncharacterized protein n=1 Tax=Araneus ventricosus TaxID=182803 RepID=A0A4Y2D2V3_ARAVE|nr:hypothetical protein AVEN_182977-1 [Araneus ventricosus]
MTLFLKFIKPFLSSHSQFGATGSCPVCPCLGPPCLGRFYGNSSTPHENTGTRTILRQTLLLLLTKTYLSHVSLPQLEKKRSRFVFRTPGAVGISWARGLLERVGRGRGQFAQSPIPLRPGRKRWLFGAAL